MLIGWHVLVERANLTYPFSTIDSVHNFFDTFLLRPCRSLTTPLWFAIHRSIAARRFNIVRVVWITWSDFEWVERFSWLLNNRWMWVQNGYFHFLLVTRGRSQIDCPCCITFHSSDNSLLLMQKLSHDLTVAVNSLTRIWGRHELLTANDGAFFDNNPRQRLLLREWPKALRLRLAVAIHIEALKINAWHTLGPVSWWSLLWWYTLHYVHLLHIITCWAVFKGTQDFIARVRNSKCSHSWACRCTPWLIIERIVLH